MFDVDDFSQHTTPWRASIANANGIAFVVTGVGTVILSLALPLSDTLLVLSLSHKLLSVSQITKELICIVLIYSTFCFIQGFLIKEIIGHVTRKGDSIIWKISVSDKHITCITRLIQK